VLEAWKVKPVHVEAQKKMVAPIIMEGSLDIKWTKRVCGTKR